MGTKVKTKAKRKTGRPAHGEPLTARVHIKITEAEHAQLRAEAEAQRRTITQVVRDRLFNGRNGGGL